jgi:hypothetical protein
LFCQVLTDLIIVVRILKEFFDKLHDSGEEARFLKEKVSAPSSKNGKVVSSEVKQKEEVDIKFLLKFIKKLKFVQLRYGK